MQKHKIFGGRAEQNERKNKNKRLQTIFKAIYELAVNSSIIIKCIGGVCVRLNVCIV